jgi:hypothetical protein
MWLTLAGGRPVIASLDWQNEDVASNGGVDVAEQAVETKL